MARAIYFACLQFPALCTRHAGPFPASLGTAPEPSLHASWLDSLLLGVGPCPLATSTCRTASAMSCRRSSAKHPFDPLSAGLLSLDSLLLHLAGDHRLFQHVTQPLVALNHAPQMVALRFVGLDLPTGQNLILDLRHRLDVDAIAKHIGGELAAFEFFLWGHRISSLRNLISGSLSIDMATSMAICNILDFISNSATWVACRNCCS